MLIIW